MILHSKFIGHYSKKIKKKHLIYAKYWTLNTVFDKNFKID